jgi:TonB family protein
MTGFFLIIPGAAHSAGIPYFVLLRQSTIPMRKIKHTLSALIIMIIGLSSLHAQDEIFMVVEKVPQFPGGESARIAFMGSNIRYPQEAMEEGIQGTVYVSFVVEKDGSISNIKILRDIGGGCGQEAVRVVSMMPKWEPGTQRGKAVRVQFNMPVTFTLSDGNEKRKKRRGNKQGTE